MNYDYRINFKKSGKWSDEAFIGTFLYSRGHTEDSARRHHKLYLMKLYPDDMFGLFRRECYMGPNTGQEWELVEVLKGVVLNA